MSFVDVATIRVFAISMIAVVHGVVLAAPAGVAVAHAAAAGLVVMLAFVVAVVPVVVGCVGDGCSWPNECCGNWPNCCVCCCDS